MDLSDDDVRSRVRQLGEGWRAERAERQSRSHLEQADFDALREVGFLRLVVPDGQGGTWVSAAASTRGICETLRGLAGADSSVTLVAAMHLAVVGYWLAHDGEVNPAWEAQRRAVFASAVAGRQWGTITSEPGSGGDISKTCAVAEPATGPGASIPGDTYRVTGEKHFGSGSGITHFMITTAVPAGESEPALFALAVDGVPWDGSAGMLLRAEWDGAGMAATQSHAMRFDGFPATRVAWPGPLEEVTTVAGPYITAFFVSVVLGVLDEAVRAARTVLGTKRESLGAYERVEWAQADCDHWVAVQAYEGLLRAIESGAGSGALPDAIRAKLAVAELAESSLSRIARVLGGGAYARRSPFSHWYEDVRALGFLRPPWALAHEGLFKTSLDPV